jgi:hypothetical protein
VNVPMLQKIKEVILAQPKRVEMYDWLRHRSPKRGGPVCGNVGCIAGWACLLSEKEGRTLAAKGRALIDRYRYTDYKTNGREALDLSREQADRLFFLDVWSKRLAEEYDRARTPKGRARVVARRIDLFIRSKGLK